jgi:ribonuclease HII
VNLYKFDVSLLKKHNVETLIGIDEAGRGPIAGPVTACACIIPKNCVELLCEVKDSKKLSPLRREKIYKLLNTCSIRYAVSSVCSSEIDKINILQATFKAMKNALKKIKICKNTFVVVDGNMEIPHLEFKQCAVKSADNKSLSVAAASIIAKVTRDRYMAKIDKFYPGYGFAKHKGYGTAFHFKSLEKLGPCPEHRKSFIPIRYSTVK